MDSNSTNFAFHYGPQQPGTDQMNDLESTAIQASGDHTSAISDASLLLGLQNSAGTVTAPSHATTRMSTTAELGEADVFAQYTSMTPVEMFIQSQDVDMSMLGLDSMPWLDTMFDQA